MNAGSAKTPSVVHAARRAFELSLRMLPAGFVARDELLELFERLALDAHRDRGAVGVIQVLLHSSFDTLRRLPGARRRQSRTSRPSHPRQRFQRMGNLLTDTRHAVRGLYGAPTFTLMVVATLALGIGANVAIFSIVNSVLIRSLGYEEPDRLVRFWGTNEGEPSDSGTIAYLNFIDIRERADSFVAAAAYDEWRPNLTGSEEAERLDAALVNAEFFDTLGVRPQRGRFFAAQEDVDGDDQVVVLSHGLWTRKFGADPDVVGTTIDLNGRSHVVIGVAPRGFEDPLLSGGAWAPPELWRPLGLFGADEASMPSRGSTSYTAIARLRPGVALEAAQAEIAALSAALEQEFPDNNIGVGQTLVPLRDAMVGGTRTSLWMLFGAVAFVLAIAVTNVANLMLSRAVDRGHETALRMALGAGRARLAQLFAIESLLLAVLGGIAGAAIAQPLARLLVVGAAGALPRVDALALDGRALGFALALILVTGLVCGLVPLAQSSRLDLQSSVKATGGGATSGRGARGARQLFVVIEVALAVVLLAGAGLLLRSFWQLTAVDKGLDTAQRLTFSLSLPNRDYPDLADHARLFGEVVEGVESIPGVWSAATVTILPLSGSFDCTTIVVVDRPAPEPGDEVCPQFRTVSPGYLEVMALDLVAGRFLDKSDRVGTERVAVLNQTAARLLWPGEDPIGKQFGTYEEKPVRVVGVTRDVKYLTLDEAPEPGVYVVLEQGVIPWQTFRATVVVRVEGDPLAFAGAVRERVRAIDPNLPVASMRSMDSVVSDSVASPRFRAALLTSFAMVAMVLATLGVYGVIAYSVSRQQREVAIRLALGAARGNVVRQVVREGIRPVIAGLLIGSVAALWVGQLMGSLLFGVSAADPVAFVAVPVVFLGAATLAAYLPARRAAALDPMTALRSE